MPMSSASKASWKRWAVDALEHAVRTFAASVLAAAPVVSGSVAVGDLISQDVLSIGLGSAAVSMLISVVGSRRGYTDNASVRTRG